MDYKTYQYSVYDRPANGTSGQDCGTFDWDELPARLQAAIEAEPTQKEWILPALSDGDTGEPLDDLDTVVYRLERQL
jgi:hypothetical protein